MQNSLGLHTEDKALIKYNRLAKNMKMILEEKNSYYQRLRDLKLISLVQKILWRQLIEAFNYQNWFTIASARGLFNYNLS